MDQETVREWAFVMPGSVDVLFSFKLDLLTSNVHIMIMQRNVGDVGDWPAGSVETVIPVSEFAAFSWNIETMKRLIEEVV